MTVRPGFLRVLLALLVCWLAVTAADGDGLAGTAAETGAIAAVLAALGLVVHGLPPLITALKAGAVEGGGAAATVMALRDIIVEMRADVRADREVMRQSTDRIAATFERIDDTLRAVERAMEGSAASIQSALEGVKANSNQLAAGIREEIKRGRP